MGEIDRLCTSFTPGISYSEKWPCAKPTTSIEVGAR